MTLLVEKGTFTKTTSTAAPVDQTVTLSNGSLTPKLVILWTDGQTTNDGTFVNDARISYGFSDGTNDACQALRSDESAEVESYVFHDNAVISIINLTTNAIVSQGDISAFNAGNFHINWSVQSNTEAMVIHYIVAGGTDITNVSCVATTVGSTGTGNLSFNGSGTTFTPDFALCMTGPDGFTTNNTLVNSTDQGLFCIGAAKSTSKRWVMWGRVETVTTSDTDMYLSPSACLASCNTANGTITFLADFVSFNSAAGGGITVNVSNGADATTKKLAFLFVKGAQWDCDAFQQRNGTGTQDVTIATGLDPDIVFLGGINTASSETVTANNYIGIGASDGTNEGCIYFGSTNGLGTWADVMTNLNTKVYRIATPNATAASSTTNAECDMTGMSTPGQFTLDWTTADATQRQMVYWVLAPNASATNYDRAPATETVSLSESIARSFGAVRALPSESSTSTESIVRMLAATRNPIETTTSTETLARLLTAQRIIDTETTTITDSVIRAKGLPRSIDTETVNISDSTSRMLAANRTLQEDTVISETLTRLLAANRSLATETVTITDQLTRMVGVVRTLATETVTSTDQLQRMLAANRAVQTETVTITDQLNRLLAATRALLETVSITDSVEREHSAGGGTNFTRSISETITISESLTRLLAATRQMSETTELVDSLLRQLAANRTIETETTSVSDSLTRLLTRVRTILETVDISESITRAFVGSRPITETVNIVDTLTRTLAPFEIPTRLKKIREWLVAKYSEDDPSL